MKTALWILAVLLTACGGATLPPPEVAPAPPTAAETDPRIRALDFQPGGEEQAIEAARAIANDGVHHEDRAAATAALSEAYGRVEGDEGLQNRLRVALIDTLHTLALAGEAEATGALGSIVLDAGQHFLLRRHAAGLLSTVGDAASVDVFVQGLLLFPEGQPVQRMNDISTAALVLIGRPALAPLLRMLAGEDERALAQANAYIDAVAEVAPQLAERMDAPTLVATEAVLSLGALGLEEAQPALLARMAHEQVGPRVLALLSLIHLSPRGEGLVEARAALPELFSALPDTQAGTVARSQLVAAALHLYDGELLDFFVAIVMGDGQAELRLMAFGAATVLANGAEVPRLLELLAAEPAGEQDGLREQFERYRPVLAAAERCSDEPCWLELLRDSDPLMVRKAAAMLGRRGELTPAVEAALVEALGSASMEVRLCAVGALDRLAISGSAAAVARIDALEEQEAGQRIWTHFAKEALLVRARLRLRGR